MIKQSANSRRSHRQPISSSMTRNLKAILAPSFGKPRLSFIVPAYSSIANARLGRKSKYAAMHSRTVFVVMVPSECSIVGAIVHRSYSLVPKGAPRHRLSIISEFLKKAPDLWNSTIAKRRISLTHSRPKKLSESAICVDGFLTPL
jgi:hypothetical protein